MNTLYLHTRDLRSEDNNGLNYASSGNVARIFILDPVQLESYASPNINSITFMIECLQSLSDVTVFYGKCEEVLEKIFLKNKINNLVMCKDYTPFAKLREEKLSLLCKKFDINFVSVDDYLLIGKKENSCKDDGTFYKKFTPFYNRCLETCEIKKPHTNKITYFKLKGVSKLVVKDLNKLLNKIPNSDRVVKDRLVGGRSKALEILSRIKDFKNYQTIRDIMSESTTNLSPYMKFNVVSVREVYSYVKNIEALCRQLYWRDFYMITMDAFGTSLIIEKTEQIKWENNPTIIKAFCEGKTGIPLIDASIRELLQTGNMHNRGRMNVSSFLIKVLRVDWRIGEKFFAQHLTDVDFCNNFGGWTWSSGLGYDSQPYFRVFNPYRQAEKHDPECKYICKWIPELKDVPIKDIHNWEKKHTEYTDVYITPIVLNISAEAKKSIALYSKSF